MKRRVIFRFSTIQWVLGGLVFSILLGGPARAEAFEVRDPNRPEAGRQWHLLGLPDRHRLAPYLMEEIIREKSARRAAEWLAALAREKDPILVAYRRIAGVRFRSQNPARQLKQLEEYHKSALTRTTRALYRYHLGIIHGKSGQLQAVCQVPGHSLACSWIRFAGRVDHTARRGVLEAHELSELLRSGRPFLIRRPVKVPFALESGGQVCAQLYSLGFPLEAAILAERISYHNPGRPARRLRAQVPFFLAGAADFESALRFSLNVHSADDERIWNVRLDWMIMAGRYPQALQYLDRITPERMAAGRMHGQIDAWSGFPISPEGLRVQSAMLLYLSGDSAASSAALKRLGNIPGEIGGAPAKHFARLRLAQVLIEDNPELAHKIAEDIVYLAQEKSWDVLEYRATVLDGWAQYYRKKYYPALINFIKARGILKSNHRSFYMPYTHTLGLLAARMRMAPRGNYRALMATIEKTLESQPYHPALYTIRHWAPRKVDRAFFQELTVRHMRDRGQNLAAIDFLLRQARNDEAFFKPGNNPGGLRGLPTSAGWLGELEGRVAVRSLEPELRQHPDLKQLARRLAGHEIGKRIDWKKLPSSSVYILHFPLSKGRRFFLVRKETRRIMPRRRKGGPKPRPILRKRTTVETIQLNTAQSKAVLGVCPADVKDCNPDVFRNWRITVKSKRVRQLFMRYSPAYDLSVRAFAPYEERAMPFYVYNWVKQSASRNKNHMIYYDRNCDGALLAPRGALQRSFVDAFNGRSRASGVWIWPTEMDAYLSRAGHPRPVYLRRFKCGTHSLRMWDLDRFAPEPGPALIVYQRRARSRSLDQAFTRHFSEQGSYLLEVQDRAGRSAVRRWLQEAAPNRQKKSAYVDLLRSTSGLRLILPALPGG